ncbi:deoxyribose-phosphate aldolase [Acididesulfobacillus acetoxydans]|uniref:Deoxyribose-phosphate aldolase n=2 Tax=Acididesulfobacillus acetoxydans TaxID=1561005 RepID=A0A8S0WXD7_9FIRM|nr:deoxyribose-phosphate aldolase [Acididesulfobacillus acetoxydans]CEJ08297.1 Deoxyribose-phosphate aldolase [Acididesulfobacillus acetoxydans]
MQGEGSSIITSTREFAVAVDASVLFANATPDDIRKLCDMVQKWGFNVCVNSVYVQFASELLKALGVSVELAATVGFPFGASSTAAKVAEAKLAVNQGATEVDMVLSIGQLRGGQHQAVQDDIQAVASVVHDNGGKALKVIIETCYLTDEEKIIACHLLTEAGADFIKTSTGYGTAGAAVKDIRLFRNHVGPQVKVKAAGGIRTLEQSMALMEAGACRLGIGAGHAEKIIKEWGAAH